MKDDTTITPLQQSGSIIDPLTEIARDGARRTLAAALGAEATSFVAQFTDERLPPARHPAWQRAGADDPDRHRADRGAAPEGARPRHRRAGRDHLRTSNPIESVFATVRHRTVRTKGALSQKTARLMVFTLVTAASKTWRKLNGTNQLPRVIEGVTVTDGVAATDANQTRAA